MSASQRPTEKRAGEEARRGRRALRTNFGIIQTALTDEPSEGFSAWARTTAGTVAFLLALQFATGVLLAFYYVPSASDAHLTVSYIEKVAGAGSWIRALHFYGSQSLPLFLVLHLAQMLFRQTYRRKPVGWLATLLLVALVMANGATGYSLPWDARAFYGTRVAASIAGGLPLVGGVARAWLLGGDEVSTLTVSRFYALHLVVVPFLILVTVAARLFLFRENDSARESGGALVDAQMADEEFDGPGADANQAAHAEARAAWRRSQLARNALVIALVFVALSACAALWPAPLGPATASTPPGYLPRPGAQFLWLFQMLKYLSAPLASLAALLVPGLLLGALALLPFLPAATRQDMTNKRQLYFGVVVFALGFLLVAGMTTVAYLEDVRDPRVREQLARQAQAEEDFRRTPFAPRLSNGQTPDAAQTNQTGAGDAQALSAGDAAATTPPAAFTVNCAKCHGAHAEGKSIYPRLIGISTQPRRTVTDLVAIMNDPRRYGLESRMPSFANKLAEEEKHAIAEWLSTLK